VITISKILCPTDFSDLSKNALAQAVALARWYERRSPSCTSRPWP
jgi:hypothetical protein